MDAHAAKGAAVPHGVCTTVWKVHGDGGVLFCVVGQGYGLTKLD
jgi:hypothetical protein